MNKELSKNKNGSVFLWVVITFSIFAIGMVYMILTTVVIPIQNITSENLESDDYAQTYNSVVLAWKYWPIVLIIGLIIVGIIGSLKKEPFTKFDQI